MAKVKFQFEAESTLILKFCVVGVCVGVVVVVVAVVAVVVVVGVVVVVAVVVVVVVVVRCWSKFETSLILI